MALKAAGRAGRKPRLSSNQLRKVEAALMKGARHHGFSADLWTLLRVATVVELVTEPVRKHRLRWSIRWRPDVLAQTPACCADTAR